MSTEFSSWDSELSNQEIKSKIRRGLAADCNRRALFSGFSRSCILGDGWSLLADTERIVHFKDEKRKLNEVFTSVGELLKDLGGLTYSYRN